jgi:hypothetical protein
MRNYTKVRIAKKSEPYIKGTLVALESNEIVLKERKTSMGHKIEDEITETLTHEILHLTIFKILKDEIIAQSVDNISRWIKTGCGYRLVFLSMKTKKMIFQSP